jgi:WD40 repeat protein
LMRWSLVENRFEKAWQRHFEDYLLSCGEFNASGDLIAVSGARALSDEFLDGDGAVVVVSSKSGLPAAVPFRHRGMVWRATFNPNGRSVISPSMDGTARIWPTNPTELDPDILALLATALSGQSVEFEQGAQYVDAATQQASFRELLRLAPSSVSCSNEQIDGWNRYKNSLHESK